MGFILAIDLIVVGVLVAMSLNRGCERALPFFAFVLVFCPKESQIPIPGLFLLNTWRVAIATFTILYFALRKSSNGARPLLARTPLKLLIALHVLWCVVSTANSVFPVQSIKQALTQAIEYYLMYYVLTHTITSARTIHKILAAMVIAVGVAALIGVFEAYTTWRITQWFPVAQHDFNFAPTMEGRGDRIISTFSNFSLFGAAIAFAIVDVFYLLQLAKRGLHRVLLWTALVIMFWCIYKTVTRGPWLALIIGIALLVAHCPARTRKRILFIAAFCVAVFVIRPGVWQTVKDLYVNTLSTDPNNVYASSYEYRWALWHVGADALSKEPARTFYGYGMGTFYDLHLVAPFNTNPAYPFESCDEAWVLQMVETGYVGLALIASLLVLPALLTLRNLRRIPKPHRFLCWVLFINLVQYYFMMTNVEIYGWAQTGYMLWMWISILMVYPPLVQRDGRSLREIQTRCSEVEPQPSVALSY